jgi:hypothetical protein
MEDNSTFFLSLGLVVLGIVRLSTLLHELGHAIPMLLLTKQTVTIYIGSYADKRNSFRNCLS